MKRLRKILGYNDSVTQSFRFISSPAGELEMNRAKLPRNHRDMLTYFSSMILDPEGHKKWMDQVKEDESAFPLNTFLASSILEL